MKVIITEIYAEYYRIIKSGKWQLLINLKKQITKKWKWKWK